MRRSKLMTNTDKYFERTDAELPNICGNCDKKSLVGGAVMVCTESDKKVNWNGTCPGYK